MTKSYRLHFSFQFLICLTSIFVPGVITGNDVHAQSPGGVSSDNTVWLKANDGVTLGTAGTVTSWTEQSGAGITGDFSTHNPGTGGTTQIEPTINPSGINFNPYMVFVSTNPNCISSNNLISGAQIFSPTEMTMFQVINLHTTVGTGVWCKWQTSNTAAGRLGDEVNNGGANSGKIRLDYHGTLLSNTVVTDKHELYTGTGNASSSTIRLEGAVDNTMTAVGTATSSGTARLSLGNENEAGGDPYPTTIDIAEFILYKRALTAAEINQVESYLAVKYGFTLVQTGTAPNNYTSSSGTIIWDNAANNPYFNNITGIGRDDYPSSASALDQKQSLSINDDALVTIYNGTYPTGTFPATNAENTNEMPVDATNFLLFGDDMGDTTMSICSDSNRVSRIGRVWKVQETGSVDEVTLSIPDNVMPDVKTLLVSTDPTFATGVTAVALTDNGTQRYASYDFSNGEYFTFGAAPLTVTADITQALCTGQTGAISLNVTGGAQPLSYSWNTNPAQTTQNVSSLPAGSYTVTITQAGGCTVQKTFIITGAPTAIDITISGIQNAICATDNGSANISVFGGQAPYQYATDNPSDWNSSTQINNLSPGLHTIYVQDYNGCQESDTFTVGVDQYDLQFSADTVSASCSLGGLGGSIKLNIEPGTSSGPPYIYIWDQSNSGSSKLDNVAAGTYHVTVTDQYGCTGDTAISIGEEPCCKLLMPNAFSPNGDGHNDEFKPENNDVPMNYHITIYDRWGNSVYEGWNPYQGWKGTYNDKPLNNDVFHYYLEYKCSRSKNTITMKGDLTLVR